MTYQVIVTREGDDWLADVPGIRGAHTFARSLPALIESIREVIVLMDDLDDDAVPDTDLIYRVDDDVVAAALSVKAERDALAAHNAKVADMTMTAVHDLKGAGYSVRDIGELLGLTAGRVSQLVPEPARRGSDRRRA